MPKQGILIISWPPREPQKKRKAKISRLFVCLFLTWTHTPLAVKLGFSTAELIRAINNQQTAHFHSPPRKRADQYWISSDTVSLSALLLLQDT